MLSTGADGAASVAELVATWQRPSAAGDLAGYRQHWDAVEQLEAVARPAARLTGCSSGWPRRHRNGQAPISRDPAAAGRPADLAAAWQWRQLETWLAEIAALPDPAELQADLEELTAGAPPHGDRTGHRAGLAAARGQPRPP